MLTPVRNRYVALAGLAGMIPLSWGAVQGSYGLHVAAFRAVVLLGVLALVDRLVVPLATMLLSTPRAEAPQAALPPGAMPTQRRANDPLPGPDASGAGA